MKLPVVDSILGGLDEAAKRLFTSSRFGEWLNQVIPCGALLNIPSSGPVVPINDPCVTGAGSAGLTGGQAQGQPQAGRQTRGVDALNQILGQGVAK